MAQIEVKHISKAYKDKVIFKDFRSVFIKVRWLPLSVRVGEVRPRFSTA